MGLACQGEKPTNELPSAGLITSDRRQHPHTCKHTGMWTAGNQQTKTQERRRQPTRCLPHPNTSSYTCTQMTHVDTETERGSLCQKHTGFPRSRGSELRTLQRMTMEETELGPSLTTLHPRQKRDIFPVVFSLFYRPARQTVTS